MYASFKESNNIMSPFGSNKSNDKSMTKDKKLSNFYSEFKIDLEQATEKTVNCVCFCPFENAPDILACCAQERILIYKIMLTQKSDKVEFDYQFIYDYICGTKCTTIALGPKTNFSISQKSFLNLAAATDDFCILVLNQVIGDNYSNEVADQQFFSGHINHINDMAFEPINGDYLASTGDDCACIIRSISGADQKNLSTKIMLSSPGVSVKWHKTEPNKVSFKI